MNLNQYEEQFKTDFLNYKFLKSFLFTNQSIEVNRTVNIFHSKPICAFPHVKNFNSESIPLKHEKLKMHTFNKIQIATLLITSVTVIIQCFTHYLENIQITGSVYNFPQLFISLLP